LLLHTPKRGRRGTEVGVLRQQNRHGTFDVHA
jgi:hypothetical protein